MSLTLIGRTSYRTFRNVWMLEELGIDYEQVLAHPRSKLAKGEKIPMLVVVKDGGSSQFVLRESAAINTYLGDKYGRTDLCPNLVPSTPRPLYEQTVHMICNELDSQGLWIHRKHEALGHFFGTIPEAVSVAKRNFESVNRILVTQLGSENYILGANFTAADILWVHTLDWAESIGWEKAWAEDDDMNRLYQYIHRCRSRPAYIRTFDKKSAEAEAELKKKLAKKAKL
uniref:GST N-terminal domain-containing protein n=1 Tax=Asterionellopsis glacialis TaxID=33640 RepID=A0A7S0L0G4_9STRA|mmetsp:Transcript_1875/g.2729  ORF Transcript_1875/g.2729 Transcript_1875/m.2729 type:complete len:228 (+) Transcript_1875:143-826(+)